MLGLFKDTPLNNELQEYFKLAIEGNFYENLRNKIQTRLGVQFKSRNDVKARVFKLMFADVRTVNKFTELFKSLFPEVYKVFYEIKKYDKSILPRALQRIESEIFIDLIAKRLSREFPKVTIYTIHDSIATTKEHLPKLRKIMNEEFIKSMGVVPALKEEVWEKDNIIKYLDELKEKAKTEAA